MNRWVLERGIERIESQRPDIAIVDEERYVSGKAFGAEEHGESQLSQVCPYIIGSPEDVLHPLLAIPTLA